MFAAPAEGTLKHFMEFAETGFADHEQAPPNQRTHATEHYAELIHRNRRYGRFRHASSLPKPTRTPSNLTPRNLPLSYPPVVCGNFASILAAAETLCSSAGGSSGEVTSGKDRVSIRNFSYFSRWASVFPSLLPG